MGDVQWFMADGLRTVLLIISAKWMAEILFSFDVCLCVCLCLHSGPVSQTKTVKAMDFIFDTHVSRDSPNMTT